MGGDDIDEGQGAMPQGVAGRGVVPRSDRWRGCRRHVARQHDHRALEVVVSDVGDRGTGGDDGAVTEVRDHGASPGQVAGAVVVDVPQHRRRLAAPGRRPVHAAPRTRAAR